MPRLAPTISFVMILLHLAYAAIALVAAASLGMVGRAGFDAINYHIPTIVRFASELPKPDLRDYLSATTPGFHLMMAVIHKMTGGGAILAFFAALFGAQLWLSSSARILPGLAMYRNQLNERRGIATVRDIGFGTLFVALAITSPLLTCVYIFTSSAWILPDNAAWLGVAIVLSVALAKPSGWLYWLVAGGVLLLLVFARQVHLWAAGPIVMAAWMSAGIQSGVGVRLVESQEAGWTWRDLFFTQTDRRIKRAAIAMLCVLPSFVLVWYFKNLWGGLTPPTFQGQYPVDMNKPALLRLMNAPAAPAFVLGLFGVFGSFFVAWWGPAALRGIAASRGRAILITGAVVGLAAALIPPTTRSMEEGRWSGLWEIAAKLPTVGHTSLLIAACSTLGGVIVAAMMLGMRVNQAVVLLTSIAGFAAAQMASFQLWQRYNEPFVLLVLIVCCGPMLASRDITEPAKPLSAAWWWRLRIAGPLVLAVLLGAVTALEISRATPQKDLKLQPGTERTKEFLRTGKIEGE